MILKKGGIERSEIQDSGVGDFPCCLPLPYCLTGDSAQPGDFRATPKGVDNSL